MKKRFSIPLGLVSALVIGGQINLWKDAQPGSAKKLNEARAAYVSTARTEAVKFCDSSSIPSKVEVGGGNWYVSYIEPSMKDCTKKFMYRAMVQYDGLEQRPLAADQMHWAGPRRGNRNNTWKNTVLDTSTGKWRCEVYITRMNADTTGYAQFPCTGLTVHQQSY